MDLHPSYFVAQSGKLHRVESEFLDDDPRGLILMWEPPQAGARYFLGCDPSVGIVNWTREFRTQDDHLIDNAAIEVIKLGRQGVTRDKQVCEFAAPVHSEDLADYINLIGRLYGLNEDEGQCPVIVEVYPGPGHMTQRRLINTFGYTNLFVWKYTDKMVLHATGSLGWFTSQRSKRDLWQKGLRLITRRGVQICSPYMVEEMADCVPVGLAYEATGTRHDDRVFAFLLALWFGREWELDVETEETRDSGPGEAPVDWQASDLSFNEWQEACEERFAELAGD